MNGIDEVLDALHSSVPIKLIHANVGIYTNSCAHVLSNKALVYTVQRIDELRAHREPTKPFIMGVSNTIACAGKMNGSRNVALHEIAQHRAHREPTAPFMLGVSETNARVDNLNSSGSGAFDDYASIRTMYCVLQAVSCLLYTSPSPRDS